MHSSSGGSSLTRDLVAADGRLLAPRGTLVNLHFLRDVAARAPRGAPEVALPRTKVAADVEAAADDPALEHLLGAESARAQVLDAFEEVCFPEAIWKEVEALREEDPRRHQHGLWTAIVAARLFRAALGEAPGISRSVGGALVHDLGMRHVAPRLRHKSIHLTRAEAIALEDHPLLGAVVLASSLGDAPAVHFALLHHTRAGLGYPKLPGVNPLRGLDLVAVASAFVAMISPRPFRPQPFNARGAADQLLEEAARGHFDARAVRMLIHCLRGGRGSWRDLSLPRRATGFRPERNYHGLGGQASSFAS